MSDQSALAAAREDAEDRQQVTGGGEQGTEQSLVSSLETEQKETEETKVALQEGTEDSGPETVGDPIGRLTPPARQEALTPALSQGEREKTAERIRQSEALPVGLRTRLAELVLASDSATAEQAIRAVEASLPGALRVTSGEIARPAHPAGDVFFHGDADGVSDEQAEALARGQLARSGMLRGQRVKVAE
jgi:hypothetical protein